MITRRNRSLVDPSKPKQFNWLRSNPALIGYGNGETPHSSAGSAASLAFDDRASCSTITTARSLRNGDCDANETSANKSRFSASSIISLKDSLSQTTSFQQKCKSGLDSLLSRILQEKNQEIKRVVQAGNGVQVTLDLHDTRNRSKFTILDRHHVETQAQCAENTSPSTPLKVPRDEPEAESPQESSESVAILEADDVATLLEFGMNPTLPRFRRATSPTLTVRSTTSEEELKRKPWGVDLLVCTEYSKEKDERLFAILDTASHKSWISFAALNALGVSKEVGKDNMGIQPVPNNATYTWTMGGDVKAYGMIKLSYRSIAGPTSTSRHKHWFYVADHPDAPFQVLLGQNFPDLQKSITNLSLVTIPHPKTKAQKKIDAARAKKAKERRDRLDAEKSTARGSKDQSEKKSDDSALSGSGEASGGTQ